jgi:AcrR family transcriptional regulator
MNTVGVMAPRSYTLGRRAETATATRRRILDAALELYSERGIDATTLTAIAERADVARGTVIHHFGTGDRLLGETLDELLERLEVPDERVLDGIIGQEARIRAFLDAMIAFQERSTPYWSVFQDEMDRPALQEREATYWAAFERLLAAALGPELAGDPRAGAVIVSLSHPATVGTFAWAFERAGSSREDARRMIADLAIDAVNRITAGRQDEPVRKGGTGWHH